MSGRCLSDAKSTKTYAATGISGAGLRHRRQGQGTALVDSGDKHVMTLAWGDKGVLLAGTADRAILYRVHPDGRR